MGRRGWRPSRRPITLARAVSRNENEPSGLQERDGRWSLDFGEGRLEVDPKRGGRITRLCWAGVELLVDESVHPANWGSTFWTSPQEDWGWPPVAALDHEPYRAAREGEALSLVSGPAEFGNKRVVVTKRLLPRPEQGAVEFEYRVQNLGAEAFPLACWEISRVPAGGLSFFATGAREEVRVGTHTVLPTTKGLGVTWFDHRDFVPGRGAKLNADSGAGWLAHVVRRPGPATPHVLLLKVFDPVPVEQQAPGEGVVELYADELGDYVEVENQGPYDSIAPQGNASYRVTWLVRALPEGIDPEAASSDLLGFVQFLVDRS